MLYQEKVEPIRKEASRGTKGYGVNKRGPEENIKILPLDSKLATDSYLHGGELGRNCYKINFSNISYPHSVCQLGMHKTP